MDSELNSLKIAIYDASLHLGSKESEEKLQELKETMEYMRHKSKKIAEMVMFCLDNRRKMETIISAYCQLILKKQDLKK
jgi:hypothetical protein